MRALGQDTKRVWVRDEFLFVSESNLLSRFFEQDLVFFAKNASGRPILGGLRVVDLGQKFAKCSGGSRFLTSSGGENEKRDAEFAPFCSVFFEIQANLS